MCVSYFTQASLYFIVVIIEVNKESRTHKLPHILERDQSVMYSQLVNFTFSKMPEYRPQKHHQLSGNHGLEKLEIRMGFSGNDNVYLLVWSRHKGDTTSFDDMKGRLMQM